MSFPKYTREYLEGERSKASELILELNDGKTFEECTEIQGSILVQNIILQEILDEIRYMNDRADGLDGSNVIPFPTVFQPSKENAETD